MQELSRIVDFWFVSVASRIMQFLPKPSGIHRGTLVEEFEVISWHRQPLPRLNPAQMRAFRIQGEIVLSRAGVT